MIAEIYGYISAISAKSVTSSLQWAGCDVLWWKMRVFSDCVLIKYQHGGFTRERRNISQRVTDDHSRAFRLCSSICWLQWKTATVVDWDTQSLHFFMLNLIIYLNPFDLPTRDVRGEAFSSGAGQGQKSAGRGGPKVKIRGAGQKNT